MNENKGGLTRQNRIVSFDNWDQLNKFKNIDFNAGKFEANGKTYYLETKMNIGRYCEFLILQRELTMGMTLQELYEAWSVQKQLLNQTRFVDAAVYADKVMNHCVKLKEKEPTVLKICTLFINTAEEDRTKWDNDLVVRKMEDWKAELIDKDDFFHVAFTLVPGFIAIYNNFTQSIMERLDIAEEIVSAVAAGRK